MVIFLIAGMLLIGIGIFVARTMSSTPNVGFACIGVGLLLLLVAGSLFGFSYAFDTLMGGE